jgi:uncharacterized membrane protein
MGTRSKLAWGSEFFIGTGVMQATALTLPHNLMACHDIVHAQLEITNRYLQKSKS